nr:MAG TPA: hypothetical protein [Caudoviricetes sp.]
MQFVHLVCEGKKKYSYIYLHSICTFCTFRILNLL